MDSDGHLTWRPLTLDDVPVLTRLLADAEKVDDTGEHDDEDDVRQWLRNPGHDLARDSRGAFTADGELVAAGLVMAHEHARTVDRVDLDGAVHPSARRRGIGTRLLRWQEERAAVLHAARFPDLPGEARLGTVDTVTSKRALAASNGYRDIRWWYDMSRDLSAPLPPVPEVPAGLRLQAFTPDWNERTRVAHNAAFCEHFGSAERGPEVWNHWFVNPGHFRPDQSFLVVDGDEIAAYLLTHHYPAEEAATGRKVAWVGQLGTLAAWRRRGLGTLLLAHALATYRAAGYDAAELGVDTENATGALGLYERLGFVPTRRSVTSVKPLGAPSGPPAGG